MKREKVLWIGISILAILNIICLLFIVLRGGERPNNRFDKVLIESLQLNESQIERFEQMKRQHRMRIDQLDDQMQIRFGQYFGLLTGSRDQKKEDSLKNELAELYKQKIEITYQHFAEIKAMCSPEQQQNIGKIVPFLMRVISPPKKEEPPRGK
jgi:periplasmic protein CpxP/Spy